MEKDGWIFLISVELTGRDSYKTSKALFSQCIFF